MKAGANEMATHRLGLGHGFRAHGIESQRGFRHVQHSFSHVMLFRGVVIGVWFFQLELYCRGRGSG